MTFDPDAYLAKAVVSPTQSATATLGQGTFQTPSSIPERQRWLEPIFSTVSETSGIPKNLFYATLSVENPAADPSIKGPVISNPNSAHYGQQAQGLMQIMPLTAASLDQKSGKVRDPLNAVDNADLYAQHIKEAADRDGVEAWRKGEYRSDGQMSQVQYAKKVMDAYRAYSGDTTQVSVQGAIPQLPGVAATQQQESGAFDPDAYLGVKPENKEPGILSKAWDIAKKVPGAIIEGAAFAGSADAPPDGNVTDEEQRKQAKEFTDVLGIGAKNFMKSNAQLASAIVGGKITEEGVKPILQDAVDAWELTDAEKQAFENAGVSGKVVATTTELALSIPTFMAAGAAGNAQVSRLLSKIPIGQLKEAIPLLAKIRPGVAKIAKETLGEMVGFAELGSVHAAAAGGSAQDVVDAAVANAVMVGAGKIAGTGAKALSKNATPAIKKGAEIVGSGLGFAGGVAATGGSTEDIISSGIAGSLMGSMPKGRVIKPVEQAGEKPSLDLSFQNRDPVAPPTLPDAALPEIFNRKAQLEKKLEKLDPADREDFMKQLLDEHLGEYGVTKFQDADIVMRQLDERKIPFSLERDDGRNIKGGNTAKGHGGINEGMKKIWGEVFTKQVQDEGGMVFRGTGDEIKVIWPNKTAEEVVAIREKIGANVDAKVKEMGLDEIANPHIGGVPTGSLYLDYGVSNHIPGQKGITNYGEMDRIADSNAELMKAKKNDAIAIQKGYIYNKEIGKYEHRSVSQTTRPAGEPTASQAGRTSGIPTASTGPEAAPVVPTGNKPNPPEPTRPLSKEDEHYARVESEFHFNSPEEISNAIAHDSKVPLASIPENIRNDVVELRAYDRENYVRSGRYEEAQSLEQQLSQQTKLLDLAGEARGKISEASFTQASDRAKMLENARFLSKGGSDIDAYRMRFIADNRNKLQELGISEESIATPTQFADFLSSLPTNDAVAATKRELKRVNSEENIKSDVDKYRAEQRAAAGIKDQAPTANAVAEPAAPPIAPAPPTVPIAQPKKTVFDEAAPDVGGAGASSGQFARGMMGKGTAEYEPVAIPEVMEIAQNKGLSTRIVKNMGRKRGLFQYSEGGKTPPVMKFISSLWIGPHKGKITLPKDQVEQDVLLQQAREELIASGVSEKDIVEKRKGNVVDFYERDQDYAAKVVSHEIFHFIDYLPQETMKRGNALGHVFALKEHLKRFYETGGLFEGKPIVKWDNKEIKPELYELSKEWRPFNEAAVDPAYLKYRKSNAEIFADAGSALINNPEYLKTKAPTFYRAVEELFNRRPEIKVEYDAIQLRIRDGKDAVIANRIERKKAGYQEAEQKFKQSSDEKAKKDKSFWDSLKTDVWDDANALINAVKGKVANKEQDPVAMNRASNYVASEIDNYQENAGRRVIKAVNDAGMDNTDLGVYLELNRSATERADLANPGAVGGKHAAETLDGFRARIGDEKFQVLKKAADEFFKVRQELVINRIRESGIATPAAMEKIESNSDYATFQVIEKIAGKPGEGGGVFGTIKRQVGTLNKVANPLTATLMKDSMLLHAAHRNETLRATVKALGSDATPSKKRFVNNHNEIVEQPSGSDLATIKFLENGEVVGYDVPKDVAEVFSRDKPKTSRWAIAATFPSRVIKNVFVTYNPFFLARNIPKDFVNTWRNFSKADVRSMLRYYADSLPDVYKEVFKGESSPLMQQMKREKAIFTGRTWRGKEFESAQTEIEREMINLGRDPNLYMKKVIKPVNGFLSQLAKHADISKWNRMSDYLGKTAAFKMVKEKYADVGPNERAEMVRRRAGTPDFITGGRSRMLINNIWLFSNVNKEGWRGAYEGYQENKGKFLMKAGLADVAPEIIKKTLEIGALGAIGGAVGAYFDEYKRLLEKVPENDKTNYHVIVLGETESGKTAYLTLPKDPNGALIGGMARKIMNAAQEKDPKAFKDVFKFIGGASPTGNINPILDQALNWNEYILGNGNPRDSYTGRDILTEQERSAGGWQAHQKMLESTLGDLGANVWVKFPDDRVQMESAFEKIYGVPIVGRGLNVFLRVSDAGVGEGLREVKADAAKTKARESLGLKDRIVESLKEGDKPTKQNARELYREAKQGGYGGEFSDFWSMYRDQAFRTMGDTEIRAITSARSIAERDAVIEKVLDNRRLTGSDRDAERRKMRKTSRILRELQ
jgi:GGDEF domain-containing protein